MTQTFFSLRRQYCRYKYTADRLTQVQTNGQQTVSTSDTDNAKYEYYPDGKPKTITYPKMNDGTYLSHGVCL